MAGIACAESERRDGGFPFDLGGDLIQKGAMPYRSRPMNIRTAASLTAILLLAACARGEDAHPIENVTIADNVAAEDAGADANPGDNTAEVPPTDAWIGKWIGVEGLVLDVQPAGDPGNYVLSVTLLDGTKSYEGTAQGDAIRFTRDGRTETIRAATGDETGLKWLAGKQNCLMIQRGEGFCREVVTAPATAAPATAPAAPTASPTVPAAAPPGAKP